MGRPERVERSVADLPTLQSIAGGFGFVLEVKNRSQHWIFKRPGVQVDWWPSTGRCAVNAKQLSMRCEDQPSIRALLSYMAVSTEPPSKRWQHRQRAAGEGQ